MVVLKSQMQREDGSVIKWDCELEKIICQENQEDCNLETQQLTIQTDCRDMPSSPLVFTHQRGNEGQKRFHQTPVSNTHLYCNDL